MREGRLGYNCENGRYGLLRDFTAESVWKSW